MTNNALRLLYDDLKSQYNVSYLLTYRLNQDVIENFFGVIRAKGGLYDHPDRLEFMYRLRSYILGRNEGSLSLNGNTMVDDTPDLETVDSLSSNFFKTLNSGINIPEEAPEDELKSLQYDGLEHLAGYICHKINNPELVVANEIINTHKDSSFTWTNQLSEGFLQKPTEQMMQNMQQLELIFQQFNGDQIVYCRNYIKTLVDLSLNVPSERKVKELFFRSRISELNMLTLAQ